MERRLNIGRAETGKGTDAPRPAGRPSAALPEFRPDPAARFEPFALTEVQMAYWIGRTGAFELGHVGSHIYQEIDCQELDLPRLEKAFEKTLERHDALRTVFSADGTQRVLRETPPFQIPIHDLRKLAHGERDVQLERLRRDLSHRTLPADQWPLFELRASLTAEKRTRLHFGIDMLLVDPPSLQILLGDLCAFYLEPGRRPTPPEATFRDYVIAEASLRQGELYRKSAAYWSPRINKLAPAPDLPLARNPSAIGEVRFTRRACRLEEHRWKRLQEHAARAGIAPSAALLAAFAEVLRFWSKSPRFTINTTRFSRLPFHPGIGALAGDFTSLTMMDADGASGADFESRARRIHELLLECDEHRYFGGLQILRRLSQIQGGRALMPVTFTSLLDSGPAAASKGWEPLGRVVHEISQTPQLWLDCAVAEDRDGLVADWDYVEGLFPEGLVEAMFSAYERLLGLLSDRPESWKTKSFDLLPEAQAARCRQINDTRRPVPDGLLQTRFFEQAAAHPERTAVISETRRIRYGELARAARGLGRKLRKLGASPNTLVAIVMEKGWEQVPAALGILESGAAYLPIDARLPAERLRHLLRHGEVKIALTQPEFASLPDWPGDVERVIVDESCFEAGDEGPFESVQSPRDIAYVIYTSGSTGLPKGVVIDHAGALNTIVDVNERISAGPEDRVLGLSALNFDLSVYDIFGLLAAGGAVVIPAAESNRDPNRWLQWIREEKVTLWNTVPALMEMLADYAAANGLPIAGSLRAVMMSGDWIPIALPGKIRALRPDARLISMGGATEASIWSIWHPIGGPLPDWPSIPYGRPMANQEFYVLDDEWRVRPDWVPGQLFIGGIGLARGYWRDPEKTAASFVDHPGTGRRLYRTGDMGRFRPDGNIEFLGREDFQVKISGFRIELGEIETALLQHPAVKEAVVVARSDSGQKRLVGYIVPRDARAAEPQALKDFLRAKLPDYMVPPVFVSLEAMPLSANGKVDRKALPAPDRKGPSGPAAPRSPTEEALAAIWKETLKCESVGVNDGFLELGGNSLQAIQILSRVSKTFRVNLPLTSLFEASTISAVAALIEQQMIEQIESMSEEEARRLLDETPAAS